MVLPLLLLCSAGIAADPCVGSCGRELNCGSLNKSFTCDELSRMRCNCVGCCRFTLGSPLLPPPPAQPPPTPRLPSPPPAQPPPTPPGLGSGLGLGLGLGSGLGLVLGLGLGLAAKTAKELVKKYLVQAGLSARKLTELQQRLETLSSVDAPNDTAVNVASLQAVLLATLPRIIAVNWEPEGGKHQLDATVTNVLARLSTQASSTKPQATPIKVRRHPDHGGTLRAAVRLVNAAEATQASQASSSRTSDFEVTSAV